MDADTTPGKLTGETLNTDQLLEALPFLNEILAAKELTRPQLENITKGAAVLRRFREGDVVCEEGDFGSTAFYIVSGRVEVSINNPLAQLQTRRKVGGLFRKGFARLKGMTSFLVADKDAPQDPESKQFIPIDASVDLPRERPIAELGAKELFGEMTCRTFQPRSATVTALEPCVMVEMLRVVLDALTGTRTISEEQKKTAKFAKYATFKGSPTFKKMMEDKYRERSLSNHLRSVPMFASLGDEFLEELKKGVELVGYSSGDDIVKQGDQADAFYLIRTGMVKVVQAMPGGEVVRTYMSRGDFFGEIGLIQSDGKRVATCRALDQTDVVRIGRPLFEQIMERYPQVRVQLKMIADARLRAIASRNVPVGMNMDEFLDQGLFEAQNLLLIDLDKCTRCDACVNACAEAHDGVTRLLRDGLRYDRYLVATACRSCHDPLCMTQCPVGSIRRKDSLEIQIESWCIGCSKCAELCPYGNINMHPVEAPEKAAPKAAAAKAPTAGAAAAGAAAVAKPAAAPAAKPAADAAAAKPAPAAAAGAPKSAAAGAAAKPAANAAAQPPAGEKSAVIAQPAAAPTAAAPAAAQKTPAAAPATTEAPAAIVSAVPVASNDAKPAAGAHPPSVPPAVPGAPKSAPASSAEAIAGSGDQPADLAARFPASAAAPPAKIAAAVPGVGRPPSMDGPRDNAPAFDPPAVSADPLLKATPAVEPPKPAPAAKLAAPSAAKPAPAPEGSQPAAVANENPATPPAKPAAAAAAKPAAAPAAKPAAAAKPAGAAAAAKPAAAAGAAAPAKADASGAAKKKPMSLKATTCDLCTDLLTPSCVYACPHDAAMRVDPARYFAGQKSAQNRRKRSWIARLLFADDPDNRTTH